MLNLRHSVHCSSSEGVLSACAIGAYAAAPSSVAWAKSLLWRFITCPSLSDFAWSCTFVVFTESAPVIHFSLNFFPPIIVYIIAAHSTCEDDHHLHSSFIWCLAVQPRHCLTVLIALNHPLFVCFVFHSSFFFSRGALVELDSGLWLSTNRCYSVMASCRAISN